MKNPLRPTFGAVLLGIFAGCYDKSDGDLSGTVTDVVSPNSECVEWFRDLDGDGHGDPSHPSLVCGKDKEPQQGYVLSSDDCCDQGGPAAVTAGQIFAGQLAYFAEPQVVCPQVGSFDYDCSGAEEGSRPETTEQDCQDTFPSCTDGVPVGTACGATYQPRNCFLTDDSSACYLQLFGGPFVGPLTCH